MPNEVKIIDTERAPVKVVIMYKKPVQKILSESLRGIGIALSSGNWRSVANAVMKSEQVSRLVIQMVINRLAQECDHLCERKDFSSILRKQNPKDLVSLNWESIMSEWRKHAPIFHSMLLKIAKCSSNQGDRKLPAICMAGGILLKQRNIRMLALQHITGLILFHGDVSKMVSIVNSFVHLCKYTLLHSCIQAHVRLNHLGLTVHPDTTLKKLDEIGLNHDEKVKGWRDQLGQFVFSSNCQPTTGMRDAQ